VTSQLVQNNTGASLFHSKFQRSARHTLGFIDLNENAKPIEVEFSHLITRMDFLCGVYRTGVGVVKTTECEAITVVLLLPMLRKSLLSK
jgi:hypothetical protein